MRMPGPSSKPKPRKPATFVPHPDDATDARDAIEAFERGEVLSAEESAGHLRELLGEREPPGK
jgi:hypothetical protein